MLAALDPDVFKGISAVKGQQLGHELHARGILNEFEVFELRQLMAAGKLGEARQLIENGIKRQASRK